jgi:hypothetical protein
VVSSEEELPEEGIRGTVQIYGADGQPVGYDAEGVTALRTGGYRLAVESAAKTPDLLVRLDARGAVQQEIPLPAAVAAAITTNGLAGIAVSGSDVWVAVQRPLNTFAVTGNDAIDDATGETVFLRLGRLFQTGGR